MAKMNPNTEYIAFSKQSLCIFLNGLQKQMIKAEDNCLKSFSTFFIGNTSLIRFGNVRSAGALVVITV